MAIPFTVHFHNMDRSSALEDDVRKHVESLARFYDRIIDCQITIETPHRHHHKGNRYTVMIKVSVPGETLVVNQEDESNAAYEDPYVAFRDAFRSARRQLQDYARIRRKKVKSDESSEKRKFRVELGQENNNRG